MLETTFGAAAVIRACPTSECAVRVVLEVLGKRHGLEDGGTKDKRFHDALQQACAALPRADGLTALGALVPRGPASDGWRIGPVLGRPILQPGLHRALARLAGRAGGAAACSGLWRDCSGGAAGMRGIRAGVRRRSSCAFWPAEAGQNVHDDHGSLSVRALAEVKTQN